MQKSESIAKIATALNKVQASVGPVIKDAKNPFFKSAYCSLTGIWEHIRLPLTEAGLSVTQTTDGNNLITTLMHVSGEYISGSYPLICKDPSNPQAVGSAMSYARRYALAAIVCAVTDDDDDGNVASGKVHTPPATPPTAPVKPTPPVTPPVKDGFITRDQAVRMFAIANEHGVTKAAIKTQLEGMGITTSKEIPAKIYDDVCEWIKAGGHNVGE